MSAQLVMQTSNKASTPASSFTPVRTNTRQHKCACGGTPGLDGECAACKAKRLGLQRGAVNQAKPAVVPPIVHDVLRSPGQPLDIVKRPDTEPRFAYDFTMVPTRFTSRLVHSERATAQAIASSGNGRDELLPPAPKPGECTPGRSESACVDGVGYMITKIANDCCTRPCTIEHEMRHVRDLDECCKAYHRNRKAPGANQEAINKAWADWMGVAASVSECQAYSNDLPCARRLAVQNGCDLNGRAKERVAASSNRSVSGESGNVSDEPSGVRAQAAGFSPAASPGLKELSGCCTDIAEYAEMFAPEAEWRCRLAAGRTIPPCPFASKAKRP
jgi:hypothetical protein